MDITQILLAANGGDREARATLIEAAYHDLRGLAAARMRGQRLDHTLTATALVHEVSMKLLDDNVPLNDRGQFFGYVSSAMRNFLVDHARAKGSRKRGGDRGKFAFEEAVVACEEQSDDLVALHEALGQLAAVDDRKAKVVEMRYFGGMSNEEVATALNISKATVKRDWQLAKGWLLQNLSQDDTERGDTM